MSKVNTNIPYTQMTLVPGLAKKVIASKKVKEFEFYFFLKRWQKSGCIKDYDIERLAGLAEFSTRTVRRRLHNLNKLGWIDIKGSHIYVRSLKNLCLSLGVEYYDNKPKKKRLKANLAYRIEHVLKYESIKENIKNQEYRFQENLKDTSKTLVKSFEKLGTNGFKAWLLNSPEELVKHSDLLLSMDITVSREQCSKMWNCSEMEASRSIRRLVGLKKLKDHKRCGLIKRGSYEEAMELRRFDEGVFWKNGKILKRLRNEVVLQKYNPEKEGMEDEVLFSGKEYSSKFKYTLNRMYCSFLSNKGLSNCVDKIVSL